MRNHNQRSRAGSWPAYFAAVFGMLVSLDTSWRFFGWLHIVGTERVIMFSTVEVGLLACAYAVHVNVRRVDPDNPDEPGKPGFPLTIAWCICAFSGFAAMLTAGPLAGTARVIAGPVLALVFLHMALGLEMRARAGNRIGALALVVRELRERALSLFGLGTDTRSAAERIRTRHARNVAHLARSGRWVPFRRARMARSLRIAQAAHLDDMRAVLLRELAATQHLDTLGTLDLPSPWQPEPPAAATTPDPDEERNKPHAQPVAPATPPPASDDTFVGGVLDGAVLAANEPPAWQDMTKQLAVERADTLLPQRTARHLALALEHVGVQITEAGVRSARARIRAQHEHVTVPEARTEAHATHDEG